MKPTIAFCPRCGCNHEPGAHKRIATLARPSIAAWAGNKPDAPKVNLQTAAEQIKEVAAKKAAKKKRKKRKRKPKMGRPRLPKGEGENFRKRNDYQRNLMRQRRADEKAAKALGLTLKEFRAKKEKLGGHKD